MYSLKLNAISLLSITFARFFCALCDISSGGRGADVAILLICFNFIKSLSIFFDAFALSSIHSSSMTF